MPLLHDCAIDGAPLLEFLNLHHLGPLVCRRMYQSGPCLVQEVGQDDVRVLVLHVDRDDLFPLFRRWCGCLIRRT